MQITFELKEMSPTEKRVFWKRYVNSVRRVLFNIFAPCVCLTLLAWLIPTIGKPYWTLHASEPGAQTSALIWLALVAIGAIGNSTDFSQRFRSFSTLSAFCGMQFCQDPGLGND